MPVLVWVAAGISGALVIDRTAELVEDSGNAALKIALGAGAVGAAYLVYRNLR